MSAMTFKSGDPDPKQADADSVLDNLTFEVIKWNYGAVSAETKAEQRKNNRKYFGISDEE